MKKYTPGPWKYDRASSIISESAWLVEPNVEDEEEGVPLVVVDITGAMGGDDSTADAYLIAAAPELLELAEAVLSIGNLQRGGIAHGIDPVEFAATIAPMARAAIAKATEINK